MGTGFKRANNIGRTKVPSYEELRRVGSYRSLFEHDWDELVVRFDNESRRFVIKTVCSPVDDLVSDVAGLAKTAKG